MPFLNTPDKKAIQSYLLFKHFLGRNVFEADTRIQTVFCGFSAVCFCGPQQVFKVFTMQYFKFHLL